MLHAAAAAGVPPECRPSATTHHYVENVRLRVGGFVAKNVNFEFSVARADAILIPLFFEMTICRISLMSITILLPAAQ